MDIKSLPLKHMSKDISDFMSQILEEPSGTENNAHDLSNRVIELLSNTVYNYVLSKVSTDEIKTLKKTYRILYNNKSKELMSDKMYIYFFILGYMKSGTDIVQSFENHTNTTIDTHLYDAIRSYKHLDTAINVLKINSELSHTDLADALGVKPNTLTNFIGRVKSFQIFDVSVMGRHKYYSLSSINGNRAYEILKEKVSINDSTYALEAILTQLLKVGNLELLPRQIEDNIKNYSFKYTTKPYTICEQLKDLSDTIYHSSRKKTFQSNMYINYFFDDPEPRYSIRFDRPYLSLNLERLDADD